MLVSAMSFHVRQTVTGMSVAAQTKETAAVMEHVSVLMAGRELPVIVRQFRQSAQT